MRVFPNEGERVETGVVQFGDDWPGVFIRGDRALHTALLLERALVGKCDPLDKATLRGLVRILRQCDDRAIEARQQ